MKEIGMIKEIITHLISIIESKKAINEIFDKEPSSKRLFNNFVNLTIIGTLDNSRNELGSSMIESESKEDKIDQEIKNICSSLPPNEKEEKGLQKLEQELGQEEENPKEEKQKGEKKEPEKNEKVFQKDNKRNENKIMIGRKRERDSNEQENKQNEEKKKKQKMEDKLIIKSYQFMKERIIEKDFSFENLDIKFSKLNDPGLKYNILLDNDYNRGAGHYYNYPCICKKCCFYLDIKNYKPIPLLRVFNNRSEFRTHMSKANFKVNKDINGKGNKGEESKNEHENNSEEKNNLHDVKCMVLNVLLDESKWTKIRINNQNHHYFIKTTDLNAFEKA